MAQLDLWTNKGKYQDVNVYRLPKELDEKVAFLHLKKIGVALTTLSDTQSEYLSLDKKGPYKPDHYRY